MTPSAPGRDGADDGDDEDGSEVFYDTHEETTASTDGWDVELDVVLPPGDPPAAAVSAGLPPARGRLRVLEGATLLQGVAGVPIYVPVTQEPGPLTEDMINERMRLLEALGTTPDGAHARLKLQTASLMAGPSPRTRDADVHARAC